MCFSFRNVLLYSSPSRQSFLESLCGHMRDKVSGNPTSYNDDVEDKIIDLTRSCVCHFAHITYVVC